MAAKITGPYKATNYTATFYEAHAYLTAAVEINKKLHSLILLDNSEEYFKPLRNTEYVNHAFGVELLLKCIMILENEHYYCGHNLFGLFNELNSSTQAEIAFSYNRFTPGRYKNDSTEMESTTLESVLKEAGNSFMDLRYTFDPGYRDERYHLEMAANLIVKYIQKIEPELKNTIF